VLRTTRRSGWAPLIPAAPLDAGRFGTLGQNAHRAYLASPARRLMVTAMMMAPKR
jgi:hypothetical protein